MKKRQDNKDNPLWKLGIPSRIFYWIYVPLTIKYLVYTDPSPNRISMELAWKIVCIEAAFRKKTILIFDLSTTYLRSL